MNISSNQTKKQNAVNHQINTKNVDPNAIDKLIQIELNEAHRKGLRKGFILGAGLILFVIFSVSAILWINKELIAEEAMDFVINNYMRDIFATFPDAYMSNNQHKVLPILDEFTNAAAAKKVSQAEFKAIGKAIILALHDKQLTYHEIDHILSLMKKASKRGQNFN